MKNTKINRVIRCQYNHWRRRVWQYIQTHEKAQRFVFNHCREWYTKLRYFIIFGESLDLRNPQSFHEKLFWLSVRYRHPLIMQCADKYRVREYVTKCGLEEILNPLYCAYDSAEQIDFDALPNQFVIKSNKGSGENFFCLNRQELDVASTRSLLNSWSKSICGMDSAEYQYSKIPFKLCCEKYLLDTPNDELIEYQFFCFNGRPVSILVRNDLETSGKNPFAISYSLDWKRQYLRINEDRFTINLPKPKLLSKMFDAASRLCAPFPHVRVDFYVINDTKLVFGELTFSTSGNVFSNYKDSTLEEWNKYFVLPAPYTKRNQY